MKSEDFFTVLSDIDEELIASAKSVGTDCEVVSERSSPWKTVAAAAACIAVIAVGGFLAMRYAVPQIGALTSGDSSVSQGSSPEYPEFAKYVYTGDYSELTPSVVADIDVIEPSTIEWLESNSLAIVIGEFVDDSHQDIDADVDIDLWAMDSIPYFQSYNKFRVDKTVKGSCVEGEEIIISQEYFILGSKLCYTGWMTPMIKGDKWIYFLSDTLDGVYRPDFFGRYPVPGNEQSFVLTDNNYGVFETRFFKEDFYNAIKSRLPDWKIESGKADQVFSLDAYTENNKSVLWTMEEFPGVEFGCDGKTIFSDGKPLAESYNITIFDVYLCDLNGDGKREICAYEDYGSGIDLGVVYVYDYANGEEYVLSSNSWNYKLVFDNGILNVERCPSPISSSYGMKMVSPLLLDSMKRIQQTEE